MKVLISGNLSEADRAALQAAAPAAELCVVADREAVTDQIADAEVYVPGPWDAGVLAAAAKLRWVHFRWAGVEGQLFPEARRSDVVITNSAGVFAVPMAEHALALMLALSRRLHRCIGADGEDPWRQTRQAIGRHVLEMEGAVLGILGYGGIGRAAARKARGLGMRVIALRRRPAPDEHADEVWGPDRLDDLLRRSDYLLICCALTDQTRGMIGEPQLALMKPTAILVNVARGAVVDQQALVEALQEGRLNGAGLDVTDPEPLPPESPLWRMDNVIITPHVSGLGPNTRRRQFELLRDNLRRYAAGEPLRNVVDKEAGY